MIVRLSELAGKEVINLNDGAKLGTIDECELAFDVRTGAIHSLMVPNHGFFRFFGDGHVTDIPWQALQRIGEEVIIVNLTGDVSEKYHDITYPSIDDM